MLLLPDLAAHAPGPLTPRRLLQLAWARVTGSIALPVRVTLRDGRQFMASYEDDPPGEIIVRPLWPDREGRRPLLFLPRDQVAEVAHRVDRSGMQAVLVTLGALVAAFVAAALQAGRPAVPRTPLHWVGGGIAGLLAALPVLFLAQRSRWLSRWKPLTLAPEEVRDAARARRDGG